MPIAEAMSMSLPVIATNFSGPTGLFVFVSSFCVRVLCLPCVHTSCATHAGYQGRRPVVLLYVPTVWLMGFAACRLHDERHGISA